MLSITTTMQQSRVTIITALKRTNDPSVRTASPAALKSLLSSLSKRALRFVSDPSQ